MPRLNEEMTRQIFGAHVREVVVKGAPGRRALYPLRGENQRTSTYQKPIIMKKMKKLFQIAGRAVYGIG